MHFHSRCVRQLPRIRRGVGLASSSERDSACDESGHNESDDSSSDCNTLRSPPERPEWNSLAGCRCAAGCCVGLERSMKICRRLPPVGRALLEALHDGLGEARRQLLPVLSYRRGDLSHMGRQRLLWIEAAEGSSSSKQLVRDDAESIDVGPRIDHRVGCCLLRRHVGRCAERHAERGESGPASRSLIGCTAQCLGDTEISDECVTAGNENVLRLYVAMNDSLRMRVAESISDLAQDPRRFLHRQLTSARESVTQVLAVDERHRVVEEISACTGGEERYDMWMLKPGRELNLPAETIDVELRGQIGRKDLDHDLPVELDLSRDEHAGHPRAAKLPVDTVGSAEYFLELALKIGRQLLLPQDSSVRIWMQGAPSAKIASRAL